MDKCAVGAINADCAVCAVNMSECQGKAPEPVPVVEPEPDPEPEQPKATGSGGILLLALAVVVIAAALAGTSKSTVPRSSRPLSLRRTTAASMTARRIMTKPILRMTGRRGTRTVKNEVYQQPL